MNGPEARLSVVRLVVVLAAACAIVFAGSRWAVALIGDAKSDPNSTWFAPYVDVTLTPTYHFEDITEEPSSAVVLGFVVADTTSSCTPSWGTYYSLDAAARALDLDRRVVRLRERGGQAVVSFGGALNEELAVACTDSNKLAAAYQSVIDRYQLKTIDFDIEGVSLANTTANARRAEAIKKLQADNPELRVWFTVPVDPNGMTSDGIALVDGLLRAGVKLGGLNVMTMNYGGSRPAGESMRDASTQALTSTWQQLDGAYRGIGQVRTQAELWAMLGATPMIGQNDVAEDVFTLKDAAGLREFAANVRLGRISMWSSNRDVECGAAVDDARASNTCSGVDQEPRAFAAALGVGQAPTKDAPPPAATNDTRGDASSRDDPRTSPYPLWRSGKAYEEGAKVVWQGRVYQAKWWTQSNQPDAPVKHTWETPWRYLGPVLQSDRDAVGAVSATPGDRPHWSAETVYVAGNEVEIDGKAFRAKWWTQGEKPEEDPDQPYDHPWEFLGEVPPKTAK
jgi:chitinase